MINLSEVEEKLRETKELFKKIEEGTSTKEELITFYKNIYSLDIQIAKENTFLSGLDVTYFEDEDKENEKVNEDLNVLMEKIKNYNDPEELILNEKLGKLPKLMNELGKMKLAIIKLNERYNNLREFKSSCENDFKLLVDNNTSIEEIDSLISRTKFNLKQFEDEINEFNKNNTNNQTVKDNKHEVIDIPDEDIEVLSSNEGKRLNKKKLKDSFKDNEKLKKGLKIAGGIAGTALALVVLITAIKSATKNNTKASLKDLNDDKQIEEIKNHVDIDAAEYIIKAYETNKEYNEDYIYEYEEVRNLNNLEVDKAIDYVNRAHKINESGFYEDATINEIVEVIKAIDDKTILNANNSNLYESITGSLMEVYNNYLSKSLSEKDTNKINALGYFAKEGSDLNEFLVKFSTLTNDVLDKNNEESKKTVYNYLNTFANSYTGYTEDKNADEKAIVKDTFDWGIAYKTFISPMMSAYITENNVDDYVCLQINMLSNYEQWVKIECPEMEDQTTLELTK